MVSLATVRALITKLESLTTPTTAVFVGGTSGIGRATLIQLAKAKQTALKVYIIGRKSSSQEALLIELHTLNSNGEFIFLEAQITLLAEVKRVCEAIISREKSVDLLWMSAGALPFDGRKETSEGLSMHMVLGYWGRMLFTALLLPLLKNAASPGRVVSILRAGQERPNLDIRDLDIKNPVSKSAYLDNYAAAAETMNTLFLERLAVENPDVVFVHKFPGLVKTAIFGEGWGGSWSVRRVMFTYVVPQVVSVMGISEVEVGQRCVFTLFSGTFGGVGVQMEGEKGLRNSMGGKGREGVFLVKENDEEAVNADVLGKLRDGGVSQVVYDETKRILGSFILTPEPMPDS